MENTKCFECNAQNCDSPRACAAHSNMRRAYRAYVLDKTDANLDIYRAAVRALNRAEKEGAL